jgi:hypothetical protein
LSSVAAGLLMFQLQLTKPADAFVSVHEAELKVTRVGSGTIRKLTSDGVGDAGAVGESWHAPANSTVHRIIAARLLLIMLDSIREG